MSKDLIEKIRKILKGKPVKRAYLFGSSVREEEDNINDIDILVELDYTKPIGLAFVRMKLELEETLGKDVDLVTSKSLSKYVKPFIEEEKILIYER